MGLWDFISHILCSDPNYSSDPSESSSTLISDTNEEEEILEESQRLLEIRKQIEYYMSPPNLNSNKKLSQIILHSKDRFINIEVFLQFQKMKKNGVSKDEIISACKNSKYLELNSNLDKVRTIEPIILDKKYRDRVVRYEGLSHHETFASLQEKLINQFPQIIRISMSHKRINYTSKVFSGIIFVEFESVESAQKAKIGFEYKGRLIKGESIKEYMNRLSLSKKKVFRHHSI